MRYDKGPQLTVGALKQALALIPDNVKVCVGIGDVVSEAHYLMNYDGKLLLLPDCYAENADEINIKTIISFQK